MPSGDRKMWLKRVLIPFWVVDIAVLVAYLVATSIGYVDVQNYVNEHGYNSMEDAFQPGYAHSYQIAFGVNTAFLGCSLLLDIISIVLFARSSLPPWAYLAFACVKTLFWGLVLLAEIIVVASVHGSGAAALAFSVVFVASSLAQLIYGAVVVHRHRIARGSRKGYASTVGGNTKYYAGYESPPPGSYSGYNPHSAMHQNPFRDPSPNPSNRHSLAAPPTHPAYESYRSRSTSAPAPPEAAATEMQQSSQAALHSYDDHKNTAS